jgi:N-acetylmuramoyl-L-alanine amidase
MYCLLSSPVFSQPAKVQGFTFTTTGNRVRLELDVLSAHRHRVFLLENPYRLVIDIADAVLNTTIVQPLASHPLMRRIRTFARDDKVLRIVVDLRTAVDQKSTLKRLAGLDAHRLVIDVTGKRVETEDIAQSTVPVAGGTGAKSEAIALARTKGREAPVDGSKPDAGLVRVPGRKAARPRRPDRGTSPSKPKKTIIAVDAGHGGRDTGAIGPRGIREKDVALAIARKLAHFISAEPDMRAVMIRNTDHFIGLQRRIQKARKIRADLFVSIHADAHPDNSAQGSSVFMRPNEIPVKRLLWLASRENPAELPDWSRDPALISNRIASSVLRELEKSRVLHYRRVQQANYLVLKCPDIPSILVETAFISNPEEEKKLISPKHQRLIARSIFYGIRGHFGRHTRPQPSAVRLAAKQHIIVRGEQLGGIALRYGVSVERLMTHNDLASDQLRAGQTLRIPEDG